jgi:hypothetical protein
MSLFEKKPQLPRKEFREILKKSDIKIGASRKFNMREKLGIEKDIFPRKHGDMISKSIFDKGINELKKAGTWEKDYIKKTKIRKKIEYLKKLEETGGNTGIV